MGTSGKTLAWGHGDLSFNFILPLVDESWRLGLIPVNFPSSFVNEGVLTFPFWSHFHDDPGIIDRDVLSTTEGDTGVPENVDSIFSFSFLSWQKLNCLK